MKKAATDIPGFYDLLARADALLEMTRRTFIESGIAAGLGLPLHAAVSKGGLEDAAAILDRAVRIGQVESAVLHVGRRERLFTRAFGAANENSMFLLGSISKPISLTALMRLYDSGAFKLEDRLGKFIPSFKGQGRGDVTLKHLLTHTSGLPDQLADNAELRRSHASLSQFVEAATRAPLSFAAGSNYQYSSMGVLLATRAAEIITGKAIHEIVEASVFRPLKMERSAQGLGPFRLEDMIQVQVEFAAPEAGGGDPKARAWDWNSLWWRKLGAPWGGTHSSARDIAKFLAEVLNESGAVVRPETARLMTRNQNPPGLSPRGLGFKVGKGAGGKGCSEKSFGHTGSTGTLAWADPANQTVCVILTSLPGGGSTDHPRDLAADAVVAATA